jgi:hypothetical protein
MGRVLVRLRNERLHSSPPSFRTIAIRPEVVLVPLSNELSVQSRGWKKS